MYTLYSPNRDSTYGILLIVHVYYVYTHISYPDRTTQLQPARHACISGFEVAYQLDDQATWVTDS